MMRGFMSMCGRGTLRALAFPSVLALGACALPAPAPVEDWTPPVPAEAPDTRTSDGAIWRTSAASPLFEDVRARRVGDVINVILAERTDASKSASSSANKGTSIGFPTPTLFGSPVQIGGREILAIDAGVNSDFSGKGDASQSNRLEGSVAVTVVGVQPNGNLLIRGQKRLTLNRGSEVVRVAGIVRAADVSPANTVRSTEIADARITYSGDGTVANASRAGWLTRILTGPLWPF